MAQGKNANASELPQPEEDHSLLIRPINVGLSGAHHVLRSIQNGTAEVRDLLLNECDLIYECRMCKSLHRSLPNFLAHKRVYCTKHCCESMMLFTNLDIENETVIVQPESPDSGAAINEDDALGDEPDGIPDVEELKIIQKEVLPSPARIFHASITKDEENDKKPLASLTLNNAPDNYFAKCVQHLDNRKSNRAQISLKLAQIEDNPAAMLQSLVPPGVAVEDVESIVPQSFQKPNTVRMTDSALVKPPVKEVIPPAVADKQIPIPVKASSRNKSPPVEVPPPPPPSTSSGTAAKSYSCSKCQSQFSSMKSMSFHMKTIHAPRRVYFYCPYCKSRFSQVYGVNRHMMSVHKKSKEQIGRLRSKIQKSSQTRHAAEKVSEEEKSEPEVKPSGSRSRGSRAAEPAPQTSPVQASTVRLTKRLDINRCSKCDKIFMDKRTLDSHRRKCDSINDNLRRSSDSRSRSGRIDVKTLTKERPKRTVKKKDAGDFVDSSRLNIVTSTVTTKGDKAFKILPVVEKKVLEIVDMDKLMCLKCNKTLMNLSNLRRHAASHISWYRFQCKHCEYRSYSRSDCRSHVKRKHITKRRLHKQLDSFVVDLPAEEVEKSVTNGEVRPTVGAEKVTAKVNPEVGNSKQKRASDIAEKITAKANPEVSNSKQKRASDIAEKITAKANPEVGNSKQKRMSDIAEKITTKTNPEVSNSKQRRAPDNLESGYSKQRCSVEKITAKANPEVNWKPRRVSDIAEKFPTKANLEVTNYKQRRVSDISESSSWKSRRASENSISWEEPESSVPKATTESMAIPTGANRKTSATPASFNISTRLSPRTFDTSPYRRSDSESVLVTRSGSYPKSDNRTSAVRRELLTPRPARENQKVLRTKVIQLKPPPESSSPSPSSSPDPLSDDDDNNNNGSNNDSDNSPKNNGTCILFSNYDDHNYSVEIKAPGRQREDTDSDGCEMDTEDS